MRLIGIVVLLLCNLFLYGQGDKEKAQKMGEMAMQKLEAGEARLAVAILKEAVKLDSQNIEYPFQLAYVYYAERQYRRASDILEKLLEHPQADDRIWEMLGTTYDLAGDSLKAIQTYDKGLKAFPKSGYLHLARGDMAFEAGLTEQALYYYEKGIQVAPYFPDNYFQAAKTYMGTSEEVWGMMYGELFLNLERNTNRTLQMSFLLHAIYQKEIEILSDTTARVSFSRGAGVDVENDFEKGEEVKLPFGTVYESLLEKALIGIRQLDLSGLATLRSRFLENYYAKSYDEDYPQQLFAYQKRLADAGHLEAYHRWVLIGATQEAFAQWYQQNEEKWKAFMQWFRENPIELE